MYRQGGRTHNYKMHRSSIPVLIVAEKMNHITVLRLLLYYQLLPRLLLLLFVWYYNRY